MATFYTNQALGRGPMHSIGGGSQSVIAYAEYNLTAALALNDVVNMMWVPAGAIITNVRLGGDQLDTGGTPTLTLDVGDASSATRFVSTSNVAQTGTVGSTAVNFYQYTADTRIQVKAHAAPATGATSGKIKLEVTYLLDPSFAA